jgi:tRNA(Ile)-lysidine synthase
METARIEFILQKECGFSKDRTLVVGVSGGPDSLCLLGVLQDLGYPLVAAHFDHRLRPDSDTDARLVAAHAEARGLPFVTDGLDVREMASVQHLSLEEAARVARYRFLFRTARERQAQAVAVAHTADDQVETVLMHLLRGSGLAGLKGMLPCSLLPEFDAAIPLARPLLETWREATVGYCREHGLTPIIDPTNADRTFFRNRLRHELVPNLQTYNPRVKEIVLRMARSLAGDYAFLQQAAGEAFDNGLLERGAGYLVFDRAALLSLPEGLARGVIRLGIAALRPALRDIDFAAVERAWDFVQSPPATRHVDLVDGLDLEQEGDRIILREHAARLPEGAWPQLAPGEEIALAVPGEIRLGNGWRLAAVEAAHPDLDALVKETAAAPYHAWLDAGRVQLPFRVRARRPGDRFAPLGLDGHQVKLSDFFVNAKLPRRARDGWPLVFSGGELAWVPGFRPAESACVRPETRGAIHLVLERE